MNYFLPDAFIAGRVGCVMGVQERRDEYLAKAKEAEGQAARTRDRYEQESWIRIAESYRALARRLGAPEG
jgi:hypothetical protein